MTTSRTTFIPLLALAGALTGCGDDATTAVSRPLPHLICGAGGVALRAGAGLETALCRPGADPEGAPPIGVVSLQYDAAGRVDGARFDTGSGLAYTVALSWDADGRLTELAEDTDGDGEVDLRTEASWTDGALSSLITENREGTPTRFVTIDHRDGRVAGRDVTDGEGTPLTFEDYTWQDGHLAHRLLQDGEGVPLEVADYHADADGRITSRHDDDGYDRFVSDTAWDWRDGRLEGRTDHGPDGSSVIATVEYAYDADGRPAYRHQTGDDAHDVTFERDAQGRVDRVVITGPAYD